MKIQEGLPDPSDTTPRSPARDRLLSEAAVMTVLRDRLESGGGHRAEYEYGVIQGLIAAIQPPTDAYCPRCYQQLPAPLAGVEVAACGNCFHVWRP